MFIPSEVINFMKINFNIRDSTNKRYKIRFCSLFIMHVLGFKFLDMQNIPGILITISLNITGILPFLEHVLMKRENDPPANDLQVIHSA